jgi:hypothetical protein
MEFIMAIMELQERVVGAYEETDGKCGDDKEVMHLLVEKTVKVHDHYVERTKGLVDKGFKAWAAAVELEEAELSESRDQKDLTYSIQNFNNLANLVAQRKDGAWDGSLLALLPRSNDSLTQSVHRYVDVERRYIELLNVIKYGCERLIARIKEIERDRGR